MRYSSNISFIAEIIFLITAVIAIMFSVNTCSSSKWNDGICPKCNERYELCAAYKGLKYYTCPACGQEMERY